MMKMLSELFDISYGHKLDFNKMKTLSISEGGVYFVGRSSQNNGVSGTVQPVKGIKPYEPGVITVALGGTKLLSSFVQEHPFYTAQNVAVLKPKKKMSFSEKVFICLCIQHNRFKYSAFGREANRTIKSLLVPSKYPAWVKEDLRQQRDSFSLPKVQAKALPSFDVKNWKAFTLGSLFNVKKGKRLTKQNMSPGTTPFIGAVDKNNGVVTFVGQDPIHPANTITINYNGSVAEAFYQTVAYWCSDDVNVLYPKGFELNPTRAMFLITVIRLEKYRFNYGRKWHLERMNDSIVYLPSRKDGKPDWDFIDSFISKLPFSSQI